LRRLGAVSAYLNSITVAFADASNSFAMPERSIQDAKA
jgi:hypothetical protein